MERVPDETCYEIFITYQQILKIRNALGISQKQIIFSNVLTMKVVKLYLKLYKLLLISHNTFRRI